MTFEKKGLSLGVLGALLLSAPPPALAQDSNTVGNPQLRDFQLQPRRQQQTPLTQQPAAPVVVAPPPPVTARPQAPAPQPQAPAPQPQQQALRVQPLPPAPAPGQPAPARAQPQPQAEPPSQPAARIPAPSSPTVQAPEAAPPPQAGAPLPAVPEPLPPVATPPAAETGSGIPWLYVLPAAALVLIGLALLMRRRRRRGEAEAEPFAPSEVERPAAAAPTPAPSPEPAPRPWLELSLKAERASATLTETVVQFELELVNTGLAAARNLRIDVKMFNAGQEQDKEIGAFFRTAGRESTKLALPGIAAQTSGVIRGEVAMPRDEMRAVVLEEKYLFVPVIAVNALYDWGDGHSGQSSKSYVVGRELEQPGEKMGAFRVDQGPRVWRTIGQRQHSLARRV